MKILCINTCFKESYVALIVDDTVYENVDKSNQQHSKTLMKQIEKVCFDANLCIQELDYIAVCVGTGSFTGIRIGMAVAKGIAQALNKKIIPIDTLNLLAYNTLNKCDYAIIKGVADEYFIGENTPNGVVNQRVIHQFELNNLIKRDSIICTNDDLSYYQDLNCKLIYLPNVSMINIVKDNISNAEFSQNIKPLYLRLSQAEMQKIAKNN